MPESVQEHLSLQRCKTGSKEVNHVGYLLGPAGVYEVVFASGLHEHPVALPHVYEADGQRA